jgi:hypothetical protein
MKSLGLLDRMWLDALWRFGRLIAFLARLRDCHNQDSMTDVSRCLCSVLHPPHRFTQGAVIVPCNATVGRSGSVLVTFKSPSSVPPYRIENRTKSVKLMLRQQLDPQAAARAPAGAAGSGAPASNMPAAVVAAAAAAVRAGAASPAKKDAHSPRCGSYVKLTRQACEQRLWGHYYSKLPAETGNGS